MRCTRLILVCAALSCALSACAGDEAPGSGAGQSGDGSGGMPVFAGSGGTGGVGGSGGVGGVGGAGTGGSGGAAGTGGASVDAGPMLPDASLDDVLPELGTIDCGPDAVVIDGQGPADRRINYIIVGDGYTAAQLDTLYLEHIDVMLGERFGAEMEPYRRYRKFVNICAVKVPSNQSGVGTSAGDTALGGYGNDETRLGYFDHDKLDQVLQERVPSDIEIVWTAVVLNGDRWWNTGGGVMVWSGGHEDAARAAMHEGGHSFQRLADEYGGNCVFSGNESNMRINVTMDPVNTADKWSEWLDFDQQPGTGLQGTYEGAQYCDQGAWRPSDASVMNYLWDSAYFNSISLEQAVRLIYDEVRPIDEAAPDTQTEPTLLWVKVVDPEVIKVDWTIDGAVVAEDGGQVLDVAARGLGSGSHTVSARAYDDTPWVRGDRSELEETREWTIEVP